MLAPSSSQARKCIIKTPVKPLATSASESWSKALGPFSEESNEVQYPGNSHTTFMHK